MARAAVQMARDDRGGWMPVGVWLAVPRFVQHRMLAGDGRSEAFADAVMASATLPTPEATWEDWLGSALTLLSNGHDRMLVEVEPELTVQHLYEREVLGIAPSPYLSPISDATPQAPTDLGGYKRVVYR